MDIASLQDGESNFIVEAKVTSKSALRPFQSNGVDGVVLNLTLMDASGKCTMYTLSLYFTMMLLI